MYEHADSISRIRATWRHETHVSPERPGRQLGRATVRFMARENAMPAMMKRLIGPARNAQVFPSSLDGVRTGTNETPPGPGIIPIW
jgi:hypothetical protein